MRAISSSTDVHGVRYTQKRERMEKLKRVNEVEPKQAVTKSGEYESRGMTKEDKERTTTMTPQEAFRKEMAQIQNSPTYRKLQDKQNKKIEEKEEQEPER